MDWLHIGLSLCTGIALAAACGFRVFVPLLALSIAVRFFSFPVNHVLSWVGSDAAFIALLSAAVVEILAYYIPLVDNALDTLYGPLALIAGTLIAAGLLPEMPDLLRWSLGIIAGAGAAGAVQTGTSTLRAGSALTTAGITNPLVSTTELGLSIAGAVMALVLPVIAMILFFIMLWLIIRAARRRAHRTRRAS